MRFASLSEGTQLLAEIREQPRAIHSLLEHTEEYERVGAELRARGATTVRMVGHGSSDNAASYGVYAFGLLPRWTALRDSITLGVYYESDLDLSGAAVLGLSQSGRTPDVIAYIERARARGAFTIAVTNDPRSELAHTAEVVLPLAAGPEQAVAATKTYLNQLAALALLAAAAAGTAGQMAADLRAVAELVDALIPDVETRVGRVANAFAYVGRMFVIGRGVEYATAREIALKLQETCRIAADSLTATDFAHGPVAALDPLFPVWAIASHDKALPAVLEAAARARAAGATLLASGTAAEEVVGADYVLPVPQPPTPLLAPLLSIVPGQLVAWAVAQAKGLDPDYPAGLSKVTLAT